MNLGVKHQAIMHGFLKQPKYRLLFQMADTKNIKIITIIFN